MLWSQKWISRAVKTMGQSDAKNNTGTQCRGIRADYPSHGGNSKIVCRPQERMRGGIFVLRTLCLPYFIASAFSSAASWSVLAFFKQSFFSAALSFLHSVLAIL